MPNERTVRVAELFKSAAECPEDERSIFLDKACAADPDLREAVESLLEFNEQSLFLKQPALDLAAESLTKSGGLATDDRIDNYRIISRIGSGGMGDVYLAEDVELDRKVALKLVRRGMSTEDVIRRFRYEERILAGLNHPNIAQLYGGGVTEDEIPFFIMEYVDGIRIDQYCADHNLSITVRLELFRKVCSAVEFAHQHLIVHRDIKPSNILITKEGETKLLDFGIAKLLDPDRLAAGDPTITIARVMTPDYASPEHVRGEAITTASDVYSLGVLLYELLTGTRPYRITSNRPEEIVRVITTQEPERPSKVVASASCRGSTGWKPVPHFRGDLDNIVLMALRKEPQRRYGSVAQFSDDIRRHLEGRPITAHRDTIGYRTSKFIARHKIGVAAAAAAVVALFGGIIAFAWEASLASAQRDKAVVERNKEERLSGFLNTVLFSSDPGWYAPAGERGQPLTLEEAVEAAAQRSSKELADQPDTLGKLQRTIGMSYRNRGRYDLAAKYLGWSIDNYRKVYGDNHSEVVEAKHLLGTALFLGGHSAEAEPLYRQTLDFYRAAVSKGNSDSLKKLFEILNDLAYLLRRKGEPAGSEAFAREALQYESHFKGGDRAIVGIVLGHLAMARQDQGDLDGSEAFQRQAVEELRRLSGAPRLELAQAIIVLADLLKTRGNYREAESLNDEGFAILQRLVGDTHLSTVLSLNIRAELFFLQGKHAEGQELAEKALATMKQSLPPGHPLTAFPLATLGTMQSKNGRPDLGESHLREALAVREKTFPKTHWLVAIVATALGESLAAQDKFTEAEPLLLSSYTQIKAMLGEKDPRTIEALQRIVALFDKLQRPEAAQYRALLPPQPTQTN
ncbi:MAG TPA: serine/threonine-protein kinase [Chthoniobacterales bacterium]|nr:serine/threonine-protein kinase [Chthoniobacterales bacterium]